MFQKVYVVKVVWFQFFFNNIKIFNAMKLYLSIQRTQINTQSCDHSYNQIELNKEKVEIKYHSNQGHNYVLCED
jgi:hypothetical protein